jgi:two-component system, LytTR family, sensor kinase
MGKILDFFKANKFHFIGWAVFITYEASVAGFITGKFLRVIDYFVPYSLNISLFYFHALIVLPFALNRPKNKVAVLTFAVVLEFLAYAMLALFVIPAILKLLDIYLVPVLKFELQYYIRIIFRVVYFLGLSTTYYLFRRLDLESKRSMRLDRLQFLNVIERKNIEKELIRSNYNYLKAQVNPHLLFKVLTFLYDKTKKTSEKAANAILVLSEMMRYSLVDLDKKDTVLVSEEVEQVKNLIYLNQLRFDNKIYIDILCSREVVKLKIIPLVLLTLVENMFKHGNLSVPGDKALISIYIEEGVLHIKTMNLLAINKNGDGYNSGLENIKKRLELAYGKTSSIACTIDNKNCFVVEIKIPALSLIGHNN